jgi:hypothetical protein
VADGAHRRGSQAEEAKRRLDSLRDPGWQDAALARAGQLAELAEPFVVPQNWTGPYLRRLAETAQRIDELTEAGRAALMTAMHPGLGAALIRETARLLKLTSIRFAGSHIVIEGTLGEYSPHLGSGTVHRRPGGSVCIVPVGSQHRGRLFLPFADDDPKTAEIVAKALLLARDSDIKDPAILAQLRS